jgi:hypothetical protein
MRNSRNNLPHLLSCSHYELHIIISCQHTDIYLDEHHYIYRLCYFLTANAPKILIRASNKVADKQPIKNTDTKQITYVYCLFMSLFPALSFNAFLDSENLEASTHINGQDLNRST